ncbi:MAG: GNAT family N-acetyltransferase [Anaerolineae bacterium]|nr:GNAT family N-acetyltransferase [Anaerolineae bacterium]
MHIETERLLLRSMQPSDVPVLVQLWTDPDVTRHMGGPRDPDSLQKSIAKDLQNPDPGPFDLWPVVEKASGQVIGHCGLLDKEVDGATEVELVYVFSKEAWGKGYATEIALALKEYAQTSLNLSRLIALIDLENTASEHVAIKAGLHFEKETLRPSGIHMRVYATADEQDTVQTDYPPKPESCGIPELIEGSGLLTWSHVVQQLTEAHTYWVVTTTPKGKPHTTPVWGIWTDGCFYFGTDRNSRQARYLAQNPSLVVHLENGDDVMILEGEARKITDPAHLARIDEIYAAKYQAPLIEDPNTGSVYALHMQTAMARLENDCPGGAGRWQFH